MEMNNIHIGMKAPDFTADSTAGTVQMSDYRGKWLVFFSHPGDFTPVCTTEFVAFTQAYPQFKAIDCELLGLSVDSNPSHLAWIYAILLMTGIQIPFPIVADRTAEVARLYNMIPPGSHTSETARNVFVIDPEQNIRAVLIYPMSNGRSIPEILRLVTALQASDSQSALTPANWQPEQQVMVPPPSTYSELLSRQQSDDALECEDWFWCYRRLPAENAMAQLCDNSQARTQEGAQ